MLFELIKNKDLFLYTLSFLKINDHSSLEKTCKTVKIFLNTHGDPLWQIELKKRNITPIQGRSKSQVLHYFHLLSKMLNIVLKPGLAFEDKQQLFLMLPDWSKIDDTSDLGIFSFVKALINSLSADLLQKIVPLVDKPVAHLEQVLSNYTPIRKDQDLSESIVNENHKLIENLLDSIVSDNKNGELDPLVKGIYHFLIWTSSSPKLLIKAIQQLHPTIGFIHKNILHFNGEVLLKLLKNCPLSNPDNLDLNVTFTAILRFANQKKCFLQIIEETQALRMRFASLQT